MINFVNPVITINGDGSEEKTFKFYENNTFELNGSIGEPTWQDVTIAGQMSLTLLNAKADGLNYLKLFGGCEQRLLPEGYTQVEYVTNTAYTRINTGLQFDFSKNYEIELRVRGVTSSWYIFQARAAGAGNISGISGSSTNDTIMLIFNGKSISTSSVTRIAGNIYYIKGTINNGTLNLYVKDETAGTEETVTGTYTLTTGESSDICLFSNTQAQYVSTGSNVYFARIKEDDNYIMDYVPCKQGTTAGFYDLASNTFKTATDLAAGADAVPTPTAPIPIWCNNGKIKVRSKSGLPDGYVKLKYLESDGNAYIDTGVVPDNNTGFSVTLQCNSVPNDSFVFGARQGTGGRFVIGCRNSSGDNGNIYFGYGTQINASGQSWKGQPTDKINYKLNYKNSKIAQYDGIGDVTLTGYLPTFQETTTVTIFGRKYDGNFVGYPQKVYDCEMTQGSNTIQNFVPVLYAPTNTLGMYDLVSNTFLTNAGTGTFTAGPVDNSIEIYADGTVETVKDSLNNTATAEMLLGISTYKDVQSVLDGNITKNVGVKVFNGSETFVLTGGVAFRHTLNDYHINTQVMSNYFNGNVSPSTSVADMPDLSVKGHYSTNNIYFKYREKDTVEAFQKWLADQYKAGTPVIVVYPLATATTESVTPQTLTTKQGSNTIEITQASITPLTLEANYKAGVSVTITEVENANLDNSVTVTIS